MLIIACWREIKITMKELLILGIPEPEDYNSIQKPTKDIPTGKAYTVLDDKLVASSISPKDVQLALDRLD